MLYAIMGYDHPDSLERRLANREAHLARLRQLQDQGRLVLAGPFPAADSPDVLAVGFAGSLIVAEFASLAEAQAWAATDPYQAANVYQRVDVLPFKQVLPA